jgi:hypothetical protein
MVYNLTFLFGALVLAGIICPHHGDTEIDATRTKIAPIKEM